MRQELEDAVDGLYEAFAGYPEPKWLEACACCHSPEDGSEPPDLSAGRKNVNVRLRPFGHGAPLREISGPDLSEFAWEAASLIGGVDDLKHYLPRLLELIVRPETDMWDVVDPEVTVGNLAMFREVPWYRWPDRECDAVRAVFRAFWLNELNPTDAVQLEADDRIDTVVCTIGRVADDMGWYLEQWATFTGSHSARRLDEFVAQNRKRLRVGRLSNAFWDRELEPARSNEALVADWLRSAALQEAVLAAVDRVTDADELEALWSLMDTLTVSR